MLTTKEKRFIRYWEEQRKGGKWLYFLLYIPVGTLIVLLILPIVLSALFLSFPGGLLALAICSLVLVTPIVLFTWTTNEKKLKTIIKREVREGQLKDDKAGDEKLV